MNVILANWPLFLDGFWQTIKIGIVTLIVSTLIGFVLGTLAMVRSVTVRLLVKAYVEILRGIPLIVNIFFVFFGAPLLGLPLGPYGAVVLGLSLWGGANGAEIVRGGLQAVPRHQSQSARALGLHEWEIFFYILMPQALRGILPAFAGLLTLLIQSTTLGALVGVSEMLAMGRLVVERTTVMEGQDPAFQVYTFVLVAYFLLCSALTWCTRRWERKLGAVGARRKLLSGAPAV
jgi:polar amino acid transport system permease protein